MEVVHLRLLHRMQGVTSKDQLNTAGFSLTAYEVKIIHRYDRYDRVVYDYPIISVLSLLICLFFLRSHRVRMPVGAPALSRQHKYCVKRAVFGVNITCGRSIVAYMNVGVTQVNVRSFWNHLSTPVTSFVCQLSAHRTTSPSGLPDYFYYSCMDCLWSIVHYLL